MRHKHAYGMVSLTFVFLMIFNYYPAFWALYHSFFRFNVGLAAEWCGLDNFIRLFTNDAIFGRSVRNVSFLTVFVSQ